MKTWQRILRENDPGTERLDAATAARIRHVVVGAASAAAPSSVLWPMRLALAGFACVVLMMSVFGTQRPVPAAPDAVEAVPGVERRQIQFATPGGTRIIWELNPNFTLMETLP